MLHAHSCRHIRSNDQLVEDLWWGESEWSATRTWLRAELEEEGDPLLLEQLDELEEWAVKASARAAAVATSGGDVEEQGESKSTTIRAQIEALYRKHNPDKLDQVRAFCLILQWVPMGGFN